MKKRTIGAVLALVMLTVLVLTACQPAGSGNKTGGDSGSSGVDEPYKMSIFLCDFVTTQAFDPTSPVKLLFDELTNTEVEWIWAPNSEYDELVTTKLASNDLPTLMLHKNMTNMAIPNAIRAGAFWEIGPLLKDYPNLSQANPVTLNNISIDGKVYGAYRVRDLGRLGVGIRKDWIENLGRTMPTTTDELFDLMVAFTNDDPDQNGQKDTWGMHFCLYTGSLDVVSIWFDAPNRWGFDADGKLIPAHLTDGYYESMLWLRDLYNEGAINQDFATLPTDQWRDALRNGYAGARVDTMNDVVGYQTWMVQNLGIDPEHIMWTVLPTVKGPDGGERAYPTTGHAGYFVISKQATNNSETELKRVLQFLDRCNDPEVQEVTEVGILDLTWWKDENGYKIPTPAEEQPNVDKLYHNLSQFTMGIPEKIVIAPVPSVVQDDYDVARAYNDTIVVGNPCEPLISKTASEQGTQLAKLYEDARVQFICGQIDEAGWKAALDNWLAQGGQTIIDETQALYDALD